MVVEERLLSDAAVAARVVSDAVVRLTSSARTAAPDHPVRRVAIAERDRGRLRNDRVETGEAILYTGLLGPPAEVIAAVYALRWPIEKGQTDSPSSRRWVGSRRIGYHRRNDVTRAGRVVPAGPGGTHRRSRMPDTTRRPAAPPRLTPTAGATSDPPPVWAHLPADRRKQLHGLLGHVLARVHAARSRQEAGHE